MTIKIVFYTKFKLSTWEDHRNQWTKKSCKTEEREKKRKDKEKRRLESKEQDSNSFDEMIAYVDEFGNITDTPPDPDQKKEEIDIDSIEVSVAKSDPPNDKPDLVRKGVVSFF